ncbi:hypothetical protein K6T82_24090, partial [Flavobacterium sp. 17A]
TLQAQLRILYLRERSPFVPLLFLADRAPQINGKFSEPGDWWNFRGCNQAFLRSHGRRLLQESGLDVPEWIPDSNEDILLR